MSNTKIVWTSNNESVDLPQQTQNLGERLTKQPGIKDNWSVQHLSGFHSPKFQDGKLVFLKNSAVMEELTADYSLYTESKGEAPASLKQKYSMIRFELLPEYLNSGSFSCEE